MIKMKITGANEVRAEIRHTAERVHDNARGFMRRAAARIVKEAAINAPRDKYRLEESIHIEKEYEPGTGRLKIDVVAGGTVAGVNVDQYAAIIHENYEDIIVNDLTPDGEQRRQGTKEKQAQYPDHVIGGKFLERAILKEGDGFTKRMTAALLSVFGALGKK